MPPARWNAILPGAVVSILFAIPGLSAVGAVLGGGVAGAIARRDGAYHGALAGVLTVIAFALLPLPSPTELLPIVVFDLVILACAAAGGWTGARLRR